MSSGSSADDQTPTSSDAPSWETDDASDPAPERVGPYRLERKIGEGGMGMVYAAHDERLDRTVALKSFRFGRYDSEERAEAQGRLVREARVMANLSHPNVVPVFDLLVEDAEVWIAMELVEGVELRKWCETTEPDWQARIDVLLAAGRGLAAAHAEGICHRDVKPANILVDSRTGAPRVLDFGLARAEDGAPMDEPRRPAAMSASRSWNATKTGTVMGTPAYMAPEQRAGEPTNALSDQYSFCVTAIEILFGYRPGEDGRIHPHDLERLPKPVRKSLAEVLQRGLARDPDDRFATLGDLLDALDRARSRPRRRLVVLSAGLGAVALAALVLSAPTRRCDDRDPLAGVWPEANRERVEARLGEVDPARGQRTVEALDDYASAYARAHAQVCQPTEAPDDPRRFDVQMSCLRRARQALAARVEVLTEDGVAMEEPARAVSALPRPQACVEAAESALTGLSPETEHEITGLEAELDRIEALRVVGRTQEALEKAEALEARTRSSNAPQLRAELLVVLTTTRMDLTMFEAATQSGLEAYELAAKIRLDDLAATAALRLAHAYGHQLGRPQEGLRWLEQAEALAPRTSDPDLRRAEIAFARGSILEEVAEYGDEGVAELERAIRLADELEGESYEVEYARLAARANLASAYNDRGRGDDALALFEQVYGLSTEMRGPEHPLTLGVAYNMALVYQLLGRLEDAVDVLEQASQYTRTGRGPSLVAIMVEANLLDYRYDLGEADLIADRLLELHAEMKALPEVLPDSLPILETVVARACRHEGRFDEAVQWANSALRGFESVWGLDGSRAAYGHAELASALYARGERDEAVRHLQRAHDIIEANTAPDNPDLARIRQNLDEWTGGG